MRKMVPDGRGNRVHFSIPDHEWEFYCLACDRFMLDPLDRLSDQAALGCDSRELRSSCRLLIWYALKGDSQGLLM